MSAMRAPFLLKHALDKRPNKSLKQTRLLHSIMSEYDSAQTKVFYSRVRSWAKKAVEILELNISLILL